MNRKTNGISRRAFMGRAGLALAAWGAACRNQDTGSASQTPTGNFDVPLGVQLYTLRHQVETDPAQAIREVAEIGFEQVEVLSYTMDRLAPLLDQNGLTAVSGHFPLPLITGKTEFWPPGVTAGLADWDAAVDSAQRHGLSQMVIAYVRPQERTSLDFYRRLSDQLNQAGQRSAQAGIQLAYHHHSFEFEPLEGEIPFEILAERLDPQLVKWQLDVFWLAMAGLDPVQTLAGYNGRVSSLHLKDVAQGAATHYQESQVSPDSFAAVGSGRLDFPAILRAARTAQVRYFFVEQDQTPGDPLDSLRSSYQYLRGVHI